MLWMKSLWLVALVAVPLLCAVNAMAAGSYGKTDVFASAEAFSHVTGSGARWDERASGFRLQDSPDGGYVRDGSVTSEDLYYNSGLNRIVISWNADCPTGTYITLELQTSPDAGATWSVWYQVSAWGDPALVNKMTNAQLVRKDAMGYVNEDTLELKQPANRLRYRVRLHTERAEVSPLVTLVAITGVNTTKPAAPDNSPGPAWGKEVPTIFRSQTVENGDMSWRICGPTSTTMALASHGVILPTAAVANTAWDNLNGIYGNWPYLAAAASKLMRENTASIPDIEGKTKKYRAYVRWCPDFKDLEAEILKGNPCVVSIRFAKGELTGAPINSTDGHLILARGFTKDGNVVCNDPAGPTEAKGRVVYNRQELLNARHGGPIIVFEPYS
jgi:hypothetical protein